MIQDDKNIILSSLISLLLSLNIGIVMKNYEDERGFWIIKQQQQQQKYA